MARKTIEVGKILKMGNAFLSSHNTTPDEREAICAMLEAILFETGNYCGYSYNDTSEIEGNGTRRKYFASAANVDDYQAAMSK